MPGPVGEEGKLPSLGLQEAHRLGLLHHESSCHIDLVPRRVRPELGPFLLKPRPQLRPHRSPFLSASQALRGSGAPSQLSPLLLALPHSRSGTSSRPMWAPPHPPNPAPRSRSSGQGACSHPHTSCFCCLTSPRLFMCGHLGSASQTLLQPLRCTIHCSHIDTEICGLTLTSWNICELLTPPWCQQGLEPHVSKMIFMHEEPQALPLRLSPSARSWHCSSHSRTGHEHFGPLLHGDGLMSMQDLPQFALRCSRQARRPL